MTRDGRHPTYPHNSQSTLRKERERLVLTEDKYHKTRSRMQHMQATTRDGSAAAALAQLTDETVANRQRLHTALPAEIRRKQLKLNTLQKVRERAPEGGKETTPLACGCCCCYCWRRLIRPTCSPPSSTRTSAIPLPPSSAALVAYSPARSLAASYSRRSRWPLLARRLHLLQPWSPRMSPRCTNTNGRHRATHHKCEYTPLSRYPRTMECV
jgi:hypothetical protein